MSMIELGDEVRDRVSGFTGIAVGRFQWLNGCVRWEVAPRALQENGQPIAACTFDEEQIRVIKAAAFENARPTGGPERSVTRPSGPTRRGARS